MPYQANAVVGVLSASRLERYRTDPGDEAADLLNAYVENARICARLYWPINIFEVVVRNACAQHLAFRFGAQWFRSPQFVSIIAPNRRSDLAKTVAQIEQEQRQATSDLVVSMLSLSFWEHLCTKRMTTELWTRGWKANFRNGAKQGKTLQDLHLAIKKVRDFRNRAFHHNAVFDRDAAHIEELICSVMGWRSEDAEAYLRANILDTL